ncbi:MAG: CYTH domain-containing protein [Candidatus Moranbacteria bacterium]|nr:CYTH domain-containing protein [Candidatus Moranbacteria bacterium]
MSQYEVEIKSLLGDVSVADAFRSKLLSSQGVQFRGSNRQLNHYFVASAVSSSEQAVVALLKADLSFSDVSARARLEKIVKHGQNHSVRTREYDGHVFLVLKASVDDTTSSNGIARMEFEEEVQGMTLDELDQILLSSGFIHQAKWSREREEYAFEGAVVTLDRNAGYGYLAEFEKVVSDPKEVSGAQIFLREILGQFDLEELSQERLERMFAHYNANWQEYYGTDKVFVIE